jgi:L-2,4-diaminobutyric acid acetyltransferase
MTGAIPSHNDGTQNGGAGVVQRLEIDTPLVADGPALHRITRASGVLDVNSCYAYLLWCRDFSRTSAVARLDGVVVGFVTGFLRPEAPDTLLVWQVAVDAGQRGNGVAGKLLNQLVDRWVAHGVRYLETTISADNTRSIKLFSGLARRHGTKITRQELFPATLFPDAHLGEDLYRIGPFSSAVPGTAETISPEALPGAAEDGDEAGDVGGTSTAAGGHRQSGHVARRWETNDATASR